MRRSSSRPSPVKPAGQRPSCSDDHQLEVGEDACADSAELGPGEPHLVGVGTARGNHFIDEAIHGIEDVAGAFAFATVVAGLAISLAGFAATGDRTEVQPR